MKKAYEKCPICGHELTSIKYINILGFIVEKKMSFITNSCVAYNDFAAKKDHNFYQIQSLYGNLYVERFIDRENCSGIVVDHVNVNTKILCKLTGDPDAVIAEYNKIIDMDYPNLIKVKRKIKTVLVFS